jgi:hypothetical protein
MLPISIPAIEIWDAKRRVFVNHEPITLQLEHSLVSLSKWESKWNKPFLSKTEKTDEETIDYIRCMTITPNVSQVVFDYISSNKELVEQIYTYINAPMTATTFSKDKSAKNNREVITSEIIYYWMISFNIPVEFQDWHLNRLITLIRVCSIKSGKPKKIGTKEQMSRNTSLNAARKKQFNSRG